jgi:hypothetical protein
MISAVRGTNSGFTLSVLHEDNEASREEETGETSHSKQHYCYAPKPPLNATNLLCSTHQHHHTAAKSSRPKHTQTCCCYHHHMSCIHWRFLASQTSTSHISLLRAMPSRHVLGHIKIESMGKDMIDLDLESGVCQN